MNQGIEAVISEIEHAKVYTFNREPRPTPFTLTPYDFLVKDLAGNYGALYLRSILFKLGVDESAVLNWRLENKLRQYEVLNYYSPGCMPETVRISNLFNQADGIGKIKKLFSEGYFLKATLGDASYFTKTWDRTADFDTIVENEGFGDNNLESYMLQKRLQLKREYRIHTFCRKIIPAFSFRIPSSKRINNHVGAEIFLSKVIERLPDQLLQGTLIGWDIGLTGKGEYFVIEGNFTGFHQQYRRGFQTTGLVDDHHYGAIMIAWLNVFFQKYYGVYVDSIEEGLFQNHSFYQAFAYYMSLFKAEHIVLRSKQEQPLAICLYLADDTNWLIMYLIKHFLTVDFAPFYRVIIKEESFLKIKEAFRTSKNIDIITEEELLNDDQREIVQHLSYERRKQIFCHHAIRKNQDKFCIII